MAESVGNLQPDYTDPGWAEVVHDTKTLDCMSRDAFAHLACVWPENCTCPCHDVCTCDEPAQDGSHDSVECHVGLRKPPAPPTQDGA